MADAGTVPSLTDSLTGYEKGLQQHTADVEKSLDTAKSAYADRVKSIDAEEAALDPNALKPPTLTQPPQPKATQPIQQWGSAAMWIAALGGLLTRRPLTNSLNAAAAVMSAYRQMDADAAKQAFDIWKVENENAVKMAQFTVDSYKAALSRIQEDRKGAMSDFMVTAKALGDENAAWVAQHYGYGALVSYTDAYQRHIDAANAASAKIELQNDIVQAYLKVNAARQDVAKAQQTRDSAAIAAATDELKMALQNVSDLNAAQGRGAGRGGGKDPYVDRLKTEYNAARVHLDNVSKDITHTPEQMADAQKKYDAAKKAYDDATPGGAGDDTGTPPPSPSSKNGKYTDAQLDAMLKKDGKYAIDAAAMKDRDLANALADRWEKTHSPPLPKQLHDEDISKVPNGTTAKEFPGWIVENHRWVWNGK